MANENITTKLTFDISDLKHNVQEANRQIALANAEFKSASSAMDDWSNSTEGLEAKLKQLTSVQEAQKSKLTQLAKEYNEIVEAEGAESASAVKKLTQYKNMEAQYNKTTKQLDHYESELKIVAKAEENAEKSGRDLKEELEDLRKELDETADSADEAGDGFTIMGGAMADLISEGIQAGIGYIRDLAGALFELPEATKEFRSVFGGLKDSAEDTVIGVEGATKAFRDFFAVSGDEGQSAEASNHLSELVGDAEYLQEAIDGVQGAWVKWGDSISIEGLAEASNETAKTGTLTGQLADALNWAGESEDEFQSKLDGLSTTEERQQLIVETLNDLYGEQARNYRENNASLLDTNSANLALLESQSKLASTIEPLTAMWTNLKAQALDVLTPAIEWLATKASDLATYLQENEGVASALGAVLVGLATAFGVLASVLAIQGLINGVTKAFALLNTTLLANPFVLIGALIAGVVVALITLWKTNEGFRDAVKSVWESIKKVISGVVDSIVTFFSKTVPDALDKLGKGFENLKLNAVKSITNLLTSVGTWVTNMITKANEVGTNFVNKIVEFFAQLPTKAKEKFNEVVTAVINWGSDLKTRAGESAQKLVDAFLDKVSDMKNAGSALLEGIWNGISDKVAWLKSKVTGVVDKIKSWFTGSDGFDTHSPSKWSESVMKNVMDGFGIGGEKYNGEAIKSTVSAMKTNLATGVSSTMTSPAVGGGVTNNFNQTIYSPKSLSRLEIYRQSKNLLSFKGV